MDHNILVDKLRIFGVKPTAINWIIDFLRDRKQRVKLNEISLGGTGRTPNKFFFNMGKINDNKKTVRELRLEDASTTIDDKQILDQIEAYLETSIYTASTNSENV